MFFELPSLASEPLNNKSNETVSVGHTAVSLHTPSSDQIFTGGGGWGMGDGGVILGYSKLKVPSSDQIFIWVWGGGILDQPRIDTIDKMNQKFRKPNLFLHRR